MNGKGLHVNSLGISTHGENRSNRKNPVTDFLNKSPLFRRILGFDKLRSFLENLDSNVPVKEENNFKDTVDYNENKNIEQPKNNVINGVNRRKLTETELRKKTVSFQNSDESENIEIENGSEVFEIKKKTNVIELAELSITEIQPKLKTTKNLLNGKIFSDNLHQKAIPNLKCTRGLCTGSLLSGTKKEVLTKETLLNEALQFINLFYYSNKNIYNANSHKKRIEEVTLSINKSMNYELTETELSFGARTAWRNTARCIGRIQWSKLQVFDARHITTPFGMFEAICDHIRYATNKGNIRSAITVFPQKTSQVTYRLWNSQFISYAGFKQDDDTIIGDPGQAEFTQICQKLGWVSTNMEFTILPIVIQVNNERPELFEIPRDIVMEVSILHPAFDWFVELGLKWYAVPGVASMMLEIGGLQFTACPFNGWYMVTEIGRDLADINRYNKLPEIAKRMNLDTKTNASLWKDKALVELNAAVIYSYQKNGVTIIDHHTASESFIRHYENENQLRGGCPADWVWIVPPLSGHITSVFHLEMLNYTLKPSYEYQDVGWKNYDFNNSQSSTPKRNKRSFKEIARAVRFSTQLMGKALSKRIKCTILYATETGKSEAFAKSLSIVFKYAFDVKVYCMADYDVVNLEHETLLLIVTSTFGNGEHPDNGEGFKKFLVDLKTENDKNYSSDGDSCILSSLSNVRFSVFALGNSSYPKFCAFGILVDSLLNSLGAERIYDIGLGDELCGQEDSFNKWVSYTFKVSLETFCIKVDSSFLNIISKDDSWSQYSSRTLTIETPIKKPSILNILNKIHNRQIYEMKFVKSQNLQHDSTKRKTDLIVLNKNSNEILYEPGDHLAIIPVNRLEIVDKIINATTDILNPNDYLIVEELVEKKRNGKPELQWISNERFGFPITVKDALMYFLDITTPVSQKILGCFSELAENKEDSSMLEELSKDTNKYEKWKYNNYPNLSEVINMFPSLKLTSNILLTLLPKLQPRFYSISSSVKETDDEIHLTIGVIEYLTKTEPQSIHYGVCSKWLDEMSSDGVVHAFMRSAPNFRLPVDKTLPVIMIGAGTGIAPYRSFWQERKWGKKNLETPIGKNGKIWGELHLYFGCRNMNLDQLYKDEIMQLLNDGVITSYYVVTSRDLKKKVYVQDEIRKNSKEIYNLLVYKNAHLYICGDVQMANSVTETIENIVETEGSITKEKAKNYIIELQDQLRFHEDIFGVTSKMNETEVKLKS